MKDIPAHAIQERRAASGVRRVEKMERERATANFGGGATV